MNDGGDDNKCIRISLTNTKKNLDITTYYSTDGRASRGTCYPNYNIVYIWRDVTCYREGSLTSVGMSYSDYTVAFSAACYSCGGGFVIRIYTSGGGSSNCYVVSVGEYTTVRDEGAVDQSNMIIADVQQDFRENDIS